MTQTNESGRSMVEMLGVLAIIGVLSVGGITGYSMAMRKYKANNAVSAISIVSMMAQADRKNAQLSDTGYSATSTGCTNISATHSDTPSTDGVVTATGCASEVETEIRKLLNCENGATCYVGGVNAGDNKTVTFGAAAAGE